MKEHCDMMIEKKTAEQFLGHFVKLLYIDSGRDNFAKGVVKNVTDSTITLENAEDVMVIDLDRVQSLRSKKDENGDKK